MEILKAGAAQLAIDPKWGARIASLRVADFELIKGYEESPYAWGSYPMAPWVGRIRHGKFIWKGSTHQMPLTAPPHAMHGTVYDQTWQRVQGDACVYRCDLGPHWPFAGQVIQHFTLEEQQLSLRMEIHSRGEDFPAAMGWHPWFVRQLSKGEPLQLQFDAHRMYERDEEHIALPRLTPLRQGPRDDCFVEVNQPVTLRWPGALELEMRANTDHWVIYDEPAQHLCVEPQTGPPDALNIRQQLVSPERPLILTCKLRWCLLN